MLSLQCHTPLPDETAAKTMQLPFPAALHTSLASAQVLIAASCQPGTGKLSTLSCQPATSCQDPTEPCSRWQGQAGASSSSVLPPAPKDVRAGLWRNLGQWKAVASAKVANLMATQRSSQAWQHQGEEGHPADASSQAASSTTASQGSAGAPTDHDPGNALALDAATWARSRWSGDSLVAVRGGARLYQPTALVSSVRRRSQAAKASSQRPPSQSHRALQVHLWCFGHSALALLSLAPRTGPNGGDLLCWQLGIDALISRQAVLEARPGCKALSPATSSCCVARLAGRLY